MSTKRDKTEPWCSEEPGRYQTKDGRVWAAKRSQCEVAIERGL
jgi:hypothetical protein